MIRLDDVSFAFPDSARREFLRGITLAIGDGEWVAIAGGNGSGKTTLCRLLAGIHRPSAGAVMVDGTFLLRDGRILAFDEAAVLAEARDAITELASRARHRVPEIDSIIPAVAAKLAAAR